MTTGKAAALTASLLARKGEAAPAVSATAFTNPNIAWTDNANGADANWFRRQPERPPQRPQAHEKRDTGMEQFRQTRVVEDMNPIRVAPKPQRANNPEPAYVAPVKPVKTETVKPEPVPAPVPEATPAPVRKPAPVATKPQPAPSAGSEKTKRVAVTLRLDDDVYLRLKLFSAKTRRTNQNILLDALNGYLNGKTSGGANGCHCLRPKG